MLPLAFGCLASLAAETQQFETRLREIPVVTIDGLPGAKGAPAREPQRGATMPALPVTRLDEPGRAGELDKPGGLSLTFARPTPIRDVLLLLFRGTRLSIVLEPGLSGSFVGELKDITLRQALESVLFPAGLDYQVDGTVVRVSARRPQTRFFSIDHLHVARAGADFFSEIGATVQAILSATGKYHVNRKAALLQVTDFADRLHVIASYLETAHLRANRQVRIHARVLEVTRLDGTPIEWPALAARPGSGIRGSSGGTTAWQVNDFAAWLKTIGEIGSIRHIAAPAILAMNNEPAILRAADSSAQSELRLTLTPQIGADGMIFLHVAPSYIDGQFTASVDTVVRVGDGETVAIGGLMRRRGAESPTEVVILLTAAVVTPAVAWR